MREKNRIPIASHRKLPQFTTMNVIDGQAGLVIYSSLIFYSLTIDNILNIIIILILASVTIQTLTGDNGLLQKATNAKQEDEEAGICENIKLAYGEYQLEQHTGTDKTAEEIIECSLKSTYDNDNIIKVKVKNEKVTVDMKVNNVPKRYIYKANTGEAYEYVDIIDYKGKEKKNLQPGDDISISTENFRVFYNKDGVIKAMPWYNIELKLENPKQSETAGTTEFSTSRYWNWGDNPVDMNNDSNKIQKYVDAYNITLNKLGAKEIEVRVVQKTELEDEGITPEMINPEQKGYFWTSTSVSYRGDVIYQVTNTGDTSGFRGSSNLLGVRPIIIIEY